jgi:hypothetical protein
MRRIYKLFVLCILLICQQHIVAQSYDLGKQKQSFAYQTLYADHATMPQVIKTNYETTNSQPKQPQTSNENNIEKIQSIHLGICRIHTNLLNLNIHHLDKVFQIYTTIYRDLPRTNENIIMLQKIQFVITMYLNTIGKGCPTIEEKLKNAASMEEQINIFLSYYKE